MSSVISESEEVFANLSAGPMYYLYVCATVAVHHDTDLVRQKQKFWRIQNS